MSDTTENSAVDIETLRAERTELASKLRGLVAGEPTDADLAHAEDVATRLDTVVASITAFEAREQRAADLLASATAILEAPEAETAEVAAEPEAETAEAEVAAEAETAEEPVAQADEPEAVASEVEAEAADETPETSDDKDAESDESESDESDDDEDTDVTASAATATPTTTQEASMPENTVNASEALDAVVASGASATTIPAAAADEAPEAPKATLNITASANVPGFDLGQSMSGLADLGEALVNRIENFPEFGTMSGRGGVEELHKHSIAQIKLDFDADLVVEDSRNAGQVLAAMDRAGDESRLPGGNVTAAGWCAPSDNLLDLCPPASLEGMLDIPEFAVKGGGVNHASGPDFASLFTAGGIQTEAEAIAGTEKTCVEVPCPDFDDTRLDAIYLCVKAGLLLRAGYPEWYNAYVSNVLAAHRHRINKYRIDKVVAGSTARTITGIGTSAGDTMDALELITEGEREKFRLGLNQSVEVAVPHWVRGILRADMSKRTGISANDPITDAVLAAHFAARHIRIQYLHDFDQMLPGAHDTTPTYPSTFRAIVYPAGTWKQASKPVINLSAVYDAASLSVNEFTGLFVEQGALVLKSCYDSFVLTIPVCNAGRTGAADLTCGDALGSEENPLFMQTVTP